MSLNLTIAIIIIFIIMVILIIKNVKSEKLLLSYSIFWLISILVAIIIFLIPNFLTKITKVLGFEISSNMIFFICIIILFYLIFQMMISLSKETKRNIKLVQEISILKDKVKKLEEKK